MKKLALIFLSLIFGIVIYYGCAQKNNPVSASSSTATSGILKVRLIDSPANYSEVNIVVDSVQAHISTSDSTNGWYTLNNTPSTYDLLKLVNGVNAVIGEDTLPAGNYSQIRLYIGNGSSIVANSQTIALKIPSGRQSGVKLNVNATVKPGITYILTLDFDASRSIVQAGKSGKYLLKPVIRVVTTATTGIISGSVSPDSVSAEVWAITGTDSVSTSTDTSGGFQLQYLAPVTYSVYIAPKDTVYKDTTITNVIVTASNTTNLGTIVLTKK